MAATACKKLALSSSSGLRLFSKLGKSRFDTLALVRKLEGQGVPPEHAEAIVATIIEGLSDISEAEMKRFETLQEYSLAKIKAEVECSLEHRISQVRSECEKQTSQLANDIEKIRAKNDITKAEMKALVEAGKYDVIKYSLATIVSVAAGLFAVFRVLKGT